MTKSNAATLGRRGLIAGGSAIAAAMVAPPALAQGAVTLRFGHAVEVGGIFTILFDEMAARVRERTNGQVTIRTFPGEQLGTEQELINQVKLGGVDMTAPSMASLGTILVRPFEMASAPFLWRSWDEAQAILEGPTMQPYFDTLLREHSILPLAKTMVWGWRSFSFRETEIRKPEDLANLKVRVPLIPVWVEMVRALGAAPTPIPFGEVYTALQQRVVDAQENPIPTIWTRKFYEVAPVISLTQHMLQNNMIIVNARSLARLNAEQQRIVFEETRAITSRNTVLYFRDEERLLGELAKQPRVRIVRDVDRAAFAARMEPAYTALAERWGADHFTRFRRAIDQLRSGA
jgi:tripartite ATP-independent transporter DctP family solute receptor